MIKETFIVLVIITAGVKNSVQQRKYDPYLHNCMCVPSVNCKLIVAPTGPGLPQICPVDESQQVCCAPTEIKSPPVHKDIGCGYRTPYITRARKLSPEFNVTSEGDFPWTVAVFKKQYANGKMVDDFICAGSLIHRKVVLTAAHCVHGFGAGEITIRAGDWDLSTETEIIPHQIRQAVNISMHPQFDSISESPDFALIFLDYPVDLTNNVELACLENTRELVDYDNCFVTGWGQEKSDTEGIFSPKLKFTKVSLVLSGDSSFSCSCNKEGLVYCKGDSGSPLVCSLKQNPNRYIQVGVTTQDKYCENSRAYANISSVRPWINNTVLQNN